MIRISEKELRIMEKKYPEFIKKIEHKINMFAHMYFKMIDFIEKLGLEGNFIESLNRIELVEYTVYKQIR